MSSDANDTTSNTKPATGCVHVRCKRRALHNPMAQLMNYPQLREQAPEMCWLLYRAALQRRVPKEGVGLPQVSIVRITCSDNSLTAVDPHQDVLSPDELLREHRALIDATEPARTGSTARSTR